MGVDSAFIVAQMGARMHYAVPGLLHEQGLLAQLYTDICAVHGWPRLVNAVPDWILSTGLRGLKARVPAGIPPRSITAFTRFGLDYKLRRKRAVSISEMTALHLWAGKKFCNLILEADLPPNTDLYCFNSAGLELLRHWKLVGRTSVLEQTIAPRRIEERIIRDEEQAYPGWQAKLPGDAYVDAYIAREEAEWHEASIVVCGSEFVKSGIAECGGPMERCMVIPYGTPTTYFPAPDKPALVGRCLRVLTVGEVCLRKGSHYVLQAARRLAGRAEFRMVGPLGLLPKRVAELKSIVSYTGVVPRNEIATHFAWADVFLLPSLCEGSATVTYEAFAAGLPVIATRNSGSILEDGISGFCVPVYSVDAIVNALEAFLVSPDLLRVMSLAAVERAKDGSLDAYGKRLMALLNAL